MFCFLPALFEDDDGEETEMHPEQNIPARQVPRRTDFPKAERINRLLLLRSFVTHRDTPAMLRRELLH